MKKREALKNWKEGDERLLSQEARELYHLRDRRKCRKRKEKTRKR
jgi:hypothetical protein